LVQRTLVYVIGLSPRLAKEELLRRHEQKSLFNLFTMGPAFKFGPWPRVLCAFKSSA